MKKQLVLAVTCAVMAAGVQFALAGETAVKPAAKADKEVTTKAAAGPGAIAVETVKAKAKVTAVDAAKRTITIDLNGTSKTVICGPEVRNFDQIKVGDLVKMTLVEAVAVYLQKAGAPAGIDEVTTVSLAPKGSKPGILLTDTIVLNAKIDAVDAKKGTLTVTSPDGKTKTIKVAKTVKGLKKLKKGDDIVVRLTEAMAIVVEAPKK